MDYYLMVRGNWTLTAAAMHYSCKLKNRQKALFLGGIIRHHLATRWKHPRLVATSRVT